MLRWCLDEGPRRNPLVFHLRKQLLDILIAAEKSFCYQKAKERVRGGSDELKSFFQIIADVDIAPKAACRFCNA